ncbi:MAG: nucleoside triphosphate pyrophosphatase [Anaerolineae bacterium]
MLPQIILASTSARRRRLLGLLGVPFDVAAPGVAEDLLPGESPPDAVVRLARLKAEAVAAAHPEAVIVACDTDVADGDMLIGKPADADDAVRILRGLRGGQHMVYSGVAVARDGQIWSELVATRVTMRDYSEEEIAAYVATGDPLDKAGAYAVQHEDFTPVERLEGCYASVVGFPLCAVRRLLIRAGVTLPPSVVEGCDPARVCAVPRETD